MNRQDPADPQPIADRPRQGQGQEQPADEGDWADEAARARTADDPRAVTPHDASGIPSTGDER